GGWYFWPHERPKATVQTDKGRLMVAGKLVAGVRIDFFPTEGNWTYHTLPFGLSDKDGRFQIGFGPLEPGIPVGKYKVTATPISPAAQAAIPKQYRDLAATPWEVIVPVEGIPEVLLSIDCPP